MPAKKTVKDVVQQLLGDDLSCPDLPTDVFGVAAFLLARSGAYHQLFPLRDEDAVDGAIRGRLRRAADLGVRWRTPPTPGEDAQVHRQAITAEVESLWQALLQKADDEFTPQAGGETWWVEAAVLMTFADEAAAEFGYLGSESDALPLLDRMFDAVWRKATTETAPAMVAPDGKKSELFQQHSYLLSLLPSFALRVRDDVVKVLPKGRTPSVGCSIRSLSHNLSIYAPDLPMELPWFAHNCPPSDMSEAMNLLLIPYPFEIKATDFGTRVPPKADRTARHNWGWFDVDQSWLKRPHDPATLVERCLVAARADQGAVHGVILPELSVDWANYCAIVQKLLAWNTLSDPKDSVQLLVAGASETFSPKSDSVVPGNAAVVTSFYLGKDNIWHAQTFGRRKHHRWKITQPQIAQYALGATLDPDIVWWEGIELPERSLSVHVFRENVSVSALICEDLARMDPCHEALRALGPNLIIALLMDGAQLPERWPARYATSLADDPGSSVLTLTSLGLMERANRSNRLGHSRVVALWKDDQGVAIPITLPEKAQAIALSVSTTRVAEFTIDGRRSDDSVALRYQCHQPVFLEK